LIFPFIECACILHYVSYREVRWTGNVACIGKLRNAHAVVRKPAGKSPLERVGVPVREVLKWSRKKNGGIVESSVFFQNRTNGRIL
jgi:hypothetical protein